MSKLTLAVRNYLAQDEELTALLGSDEDWDTWIFEDYPEVSIENSSKVLVVVAPAGFGAMLPTHTAQFPNIFVDVWADSTRNPDNSTRVRDADDKIDAVWRRIIKNLHTVNLSASDADPVLAGDRGDIRIWGTEEEILTRTGIPILASACTMQTIDDVKNSEGTRMGRLQFDLITL